MRLCCKDVIAQIVVTVKAGNFVMDDERHIWLNTWMLLPREPMILTYRIVDSYAIGV